MKKKLQFTLAVITGLIFVFTSMGFSIQMAHADQEKPPEKESGETTSSTTLLGPELSPDGPLPGPGGQSGILVSRIVWNTNFIWGEGEIIVQGSPTAKAWTTFSNSGGGSHSTKNNPCWTTTSCKSPSNKFLKLTTSSYLNFAETIIYWSNGTQSYGNATVTKNF
ncbi:MAG: hypothetical protein Fur0022_18170 [Anaerolineales bacterium]